LTEKNQGQIQGVSLEEEIGEVGTISGFGAADYNTGTDYEYTAAGVTASAPVSQTVSEIGSYYDYEPVPDPKFLLADDEWLAKVRQVNISRLEA
jgi:hypothetical protein